MYRRPQKFAPGARSTLVRYVLPIRCCVLSAFSSVVCRDGECASGSGMNGINGVGGTSRNGMAAEASAYPLVEATVEFLREFVVDDDRSKDLKEKGKANANANVNGKVALGSASG
jgi:hypothetical protein